ncbi:MAG: AraC family transcriptional regulator [Parasphingorhabdus sp.]
MNERNQISTLEGLFDCLPDTVFFTKDIDGDYMSVNNTLVERSGLQHKSELIGRRPSQVLGARLGASYEGQDQQVISTGQAITNKLEMHIYPNRKVGWCLTNKHALFDENDILIGIAGVSQDLRAPDTSHSEYERLVVAIDHVMENLSEAPEIDSLAKMACLSAYQVDRRIRDIFGLTTGQWILKQRLEFARQELLKTNKPIASISLDTGYADQSAFTRQFRKATGFTPSQFRRAWSL